MEIRIKLKQGHPKREMYFFNHLINDREFKTIDIKPNEEKTLDTDGVKFWFTIEKKQSAGRPRNIENK
jgi:hypothetical protein